MSPTPKHVRQIERTFSMEYKSFLLLCVFGWLGCTITYFEIPDNTGIWFLLLQF